MLNREEKEASIKNFERHESDTGSPEVQVALLTGRINQLADHFKVHRKDNNSRRGLLMLISRRRKHLAYLRKTDPSRYEAVIAKLGLRR